MAKQSKKASPKARQKAPFIVKITNTDDDDGGVLATVEGRGAQKWADDEMSIGGSSWETPDDMPNVAYAALSDYPGLIADLEAEGYEIDDSEYCPPDDEPCGEAALS